MIKQLIIMKKNNILSILFMPKKLFKLFKIVETTKDSVY